ncbi:unnamed protein product [Phaedon cochleariae]|uniref:Alpha-methylacyl-CoA racemase n=1 Tax=Phaedon cochleariae TaxID=80249 RepID=A0A9N9SKL2_PHACE|nr:unnamed protein product [Phaedon cochleariae]
MNLDLLKVAMALRGLKVLEFNGLLPVPFCGMVLAGSVTRIDKIGFDTTLDCLGNGKKSISLDLKHPKGVDIVKCLSRKSDVLIEPFRRGVMERLGLGPDVLLKDNPELIYARLTGYGHIGPYSRNAGHDINYLALSGLLSTFGRYGENPNPPVNLLADIGGGGLTCTLGILLALIERSKSGLGQIVDNTMVEGSAYLGSWLYRAKKHQLWGNERGRNTLDGGRHYYEVYKTKDGKFVTVGALEPQFYKVLLKGLQLTEEEAPQVSSSREYEKVKNIFKKKFLEKTRDEWSEIFGYTDACVAPVLTIDEAPHFPHNAIRDSFVKTGDIVAPNPHPRLSNTPGVSKATEPLPETGEHTKEILVDLGFTSEEIHHLQRDRVIECFQAS